MKTQKAKKQNKTKQNKTKQNKTKQTKTKQNKNKTKQTKQNKTKTKKTKQNKTLQHYITLIPILKRIIHFVEQFIDLHYRLITSTAP